MRIRTTVQVEGVLSRERLERLVLNALPDPKDFGTRRELKIELFVQVPRGGDYSGCRLDVAETPVQYRATWVEISEDQE